MERLTTRDLAARTHLAPQTILNYVKEGIVSPIDVLPDGRCYFDVSVADELITRNLLKKYPNHTAVVVLYNDEDSMKKFETTYDSYLKKEGKVRIDNLTDTVAEVRERIEKNAMHDRLFCIHLYEKILRKCSSEMQKASAEFQTRVMSNPKLEDRKLLAENLEELVSDRKSVMEKLNANDKKIVENSAYWLAEQNEKILERYSYKKVMELKEKLNTSKDILDHFEFVPKTNIVKNLVRKEKQSFFAKTVDSRLEQLLQKGYVSIIKINCTEEQAIYELLSKTYFVNDITLYGCSNATPEMQQVIQFLQDRKRVDFGEVEVQ